MTPVDWMAAGGTLGGWIDRGGTLPAEVIGRSARVHERRYGSVFAPMRESAAVVAGHDHWCRENADYFNPLHDSSPRSEFGLWLRGPATPYGPFGPGFAT